MHQSLWRISALLLAFAFTDCLTAANCVAGEDAKGPNFVVFLVDDLGFMDIGANNPDCFYETPNIDRLAKSGMRFTDGYAANPVCSPTRYSLMTGKYPTRVRATNFFSGRRGGKFKPAPLNSNMPLDEITVAQALKTKGYSTFFAGKWHLGESKEYFPQNRGFDVNIGGHTKGGPYTGKRYFAPFENPEMQVESPPGDHLPARLARDTSQFIADNKDNPFLAYLAFYSVHTPLMGRPDLVEKYKLKAAEINGEEFADEEQIFSGKPRKVRILQKHAVYAAMVEAMDQAVGKVLQQLEDSGVADNTVVVFTSDNGGLSTSEGSPTSNLPLRGGKGWVYEGGIREPWIVRYPGITKAGSTSDQPICSIDLFPTIAAAAGIDVQHEIDGIDLAPALQDNSLDRDALFWHYPHYSNQGGIPGGAIRMGDYKLFERYEDGRVHLYNLKDDVGETKDLSSELPERTQEMRDRLHAWYKTVDAQFLQEKDGMIPWSPGDDVAAKAVAKPNIVYIMMDEWGYFESSGMNHPILKTPNIDRMAKEGIRFSQFLAGGNVCAPTRSTLMTGQHTGHTTVRSNGGGSALTANDTTIADILKEQGYATGGFGKWGLGDAGTTGVPENHGFDKFFGYYHQVHAHCYYPRYLIRNSEKVQLKGNTGDPFVGEVFAQDLIHEEGLQFIRDNKDGPFFAYMPWTPPHGHWGMPKDDPAWLKYKDKAWDAKNQRGTHDAQTYAAMVEMVDRQIGEVFALLKELKIDDNTIVFVCGDNGGQPYFQDEKHPHGFLAPNLNPITGERFRGGKGNFYEGGLRVPFIVRWPGKIQPGTKSDHLGYFPDVMPTLTELAGGAPYAGTDGISIVPTLLSESVVGRSQGQHKFLYWEDRKGVAVRMDDWKAISPGKGKPFELYNLSNDIQELQDLAKVSPKVLQQMTTLAKAAHSAPTTGKVLDPKIGFKGHTAP